MVALLGSEEAKYYHDELFCQLCQASIRRMLSRNHDAWECKWHPLVGFGYHIWTLGWYMNTLEARMRSKKLDEFPFFFKQTHACKANQASRSYSQHF